MFAAAENLEFEKAARLRDQIKALELEGGEAPAESGFFDPYAKKKKSSGKPKKAASKQGGGWKSAARKSSKWKPG